MFSTFYKKKLDELLYHSQKNLPSNLANDKLITQAFKFAYEAHKNDKRASGEPFISHPYDVALILAKEIPLDTVSIASALLHDVVEDTKFTLNDLRAEFGEEIAEIVNMGKLKPLIDSRQFTLETVLKGLALKVSP